MKRLTRAAIRKLVLALAAAAVLLIAVFFGMKSLNDRNEASAGAETDVVLPSPAASAAPAATLTPEEAEKDRKAGVITQDNERLNRFLTGFVQQEIENTATELDEDAELVRFVFRYLQTNDPKSVLEKEEGGESFRILTLEQVNATLSRLLGRTVTPDQEDYSILTQGTEEFHCFYRSGSFWHSAPFHTDQYGFPLRFALVKSVDKETCTLQFKLYKANPLVWEVGEADRHVPLLPAMSIRDAESGYGHDVIIPLGEGEATLRDLGAELQLVEMTTVLYH